MDVNQIIGELSRNRGYFPLEVLLEVHQQKETFIPLFIKEIEAITSDQNHPVYQESEVGAYFLHIYALYFLSYWRVTDAYPVVMRFLSEASVDHDLILGDVATEGVQSIIFSLYNGDIDSIHQLINNDAIDQYMRSSVMGVFKELFIENKISQSQFKEILTHYFEKYLHDEADQAEDGYFLTSVVLEMGEVGFKEKLPEIKTAFDQGLIDELDVDFDWIAEDMEANSLDAPDEIDCYGYIGKPEEVLEGWACFNEPEEDYDSFDYDDTEWSDLDSTPTSMQMPYVAPDKVGRNDPCPCGSQKKYKKCCL